MCLVVEATMLFKIKAVRRDLRKFSRPTQFLILLNLNKLSDCGGERGGCIQKSATFEAGMLLITNGARKGLPRKFLKINHLSRNAIMLLKMQEIA